MKQNLKIGRFFGALWIVFLLTASIHAATWHVAATGTEAGDGSEKLPFSSLPKAVEAAAKAGDASEIVIHAGTYRGDSMVPEFKGTGEAAAWTIRAATKPDGSYEEVIIDGGQKITDAVLVDKEKGIYFQPFSLANFEPSMWEADTRVRYPFVADRRSVEAFPGSLAPGYHAIQGDSRQGVFFRTSDSKPPSAHELGMARDRYGLVVRRPNVTVKGLRFRNLQLYFGVGGVSIEAARVTVQDCDGWNCYGLVGVSEKIEDARIINCTARDVARGVKSYGINTVVENCRFFRIEDAFVIQEDEQDQCGIQFYSSNTQTARGNLCVGFNLGIFIKASGGVAILENNTVIASPTNGERGIGPNTWRPKTICRGNVIVGYPEPLSHGELIKDCVISNNLVWREGHRKELDAEVARIKAGNGGENTVAPPQFIDVAKEDFRLASTSAGAALGLEGKPVGAMGVAPKDVLAKAAEVKTQAVDEKSTRAASIVGQPVIYTSDRGAIIVFKTDAPCTTVVEWGADKNKLDQRVDDENVYRAAPPTKEMVDAKLPLIDEASKRTDHSLAILSAEAGRTYFYQIKLNGNSGPGTPVRSGQFALKGAARTLQVATTGADEETAGTSEKPFATIQYAVDRALPGDRVLVAPGVYVESIRITHGGVKDYPLVIESAEPWSSPSGGAILDGMRKFTHAIQLGHVASTPEIWALGCLQPSGVDFVRIKGFEMRWYDGMMVQAREARDISVEGCKFWSRHYVKGRPGVGEGVGFIHCERATVDHNLFFVLNAAVRFNSSSGLRLTSNTAAKCFHRTIGIVAAKDIYLRNNSFAFGASYILTIHGVEQNAIDSDYNNFAVHLREDALGYKTAPEVEKLKREDNDFYYGESKSLAAWDERTPAKLKADDYLATLTAWRQATGQDKHSIAVHPRYADPQNRDFRLLPNSPNIGKGENGVNIGALGVGKK